MIKIGLLTTLLGPYQVNGEDGRRGAEMALTEFNAQAGGHEIKLMVRGTTAMPDFARDAAMQLLNQDKVDLIVGPLSGDEGVAVREVARENPDRVFVNGASGSQVIYNSVPNFYSFSGNGVQFMAGLGKYCFQQKGYRRIVTIGEAYSFPFAQVGGFGLEFVRAGGKITQMQWCALGTQDYKPYIEKIPADADAIFTTLGGADGLSFLRQLSASQRNLPIIAGSICADSSLLHFVRAQADMLVGVLSAGPLADDNPRPEWQSFVQRYLSTFPNAFYSPSLLAYGYYANMKAVLVALGQVNGNLSDGQSALKEALGKLAFDTPTGPVRLDHHRAAITTNFVTEIAVKPDGTLYTHLLTETPDVTCTLGMTDAEYLKLGRFTAAMMPWQQASNPVMEKLEQLKKQRGK